MRKVSQNFVIDLLGLVCFVFLVSTGVIMYYLLPAGSGHSMGIWGLDRHGWGDIHFYVAVTFLAVIAFHLIWHWRWITGFLLGKRRQEYNRRAVLSIIGVVALLAIGFAPVLSPVQTIEGAENVEHQDGQATHQIRGSMSLNEVHRTAGVPVEYLLRELNLPPETDRNQPLRELKDAHGFDMDRVNELVEKYR